MQFVIEMDGKDVYVDQKDLPQLKKKLSAKHRKDKPVTDSEGVKKMLEDEIEKNNSELADRLTKAVKSMNLSKGKQEAPIKNIVIEDGSITRDWRGFISGVKLRIERD